MAPARDYIPALAYGHKILPNDVAGMVGLPHVGDIFYIDPTAGNDSANGGREQGDAFATVAQALSASTSGQHDVNIIAPSGGTGRTSETTAINWNKRFTHLIGNAAPVFENQRAGMTFATGGSIVFSENGCIIKNITLTSSADIDVTVEVTGNRNSFQGVNFKGTSNATSIASTPWRALLLTGAEENYFGGCTIGGDTYLRSAVNSSLEFLTATARNVFEDCFFPIQTDDAGVFFVTATNNADIDRWVWFKNCVFHNGINASSTQMTDGMDIQAAVGGTVIIDGCTMLGATDWANDFTSVFGCNMAKITASDAGHMEKLAT